MINPEFLSGTEVYFFCPKLKILHPKQQYTSIGAHFGHHKLDPILNISTYASKFLTGLGGEKRS